MTLKPGTFPIYYEASWVSFALSFGGNDCVRGSEKGRKLYLCGILCFSNSWLLATTLTFHIYIWNIDFHIDILKKQFLSLQDAEVVITFTIWLKPAQHDLRLISTLYLPSWTSKLAFYTTWARSPCFYFSAALNRSGQIHVFQGLVC